MSARSYLALALCVVLPSPHFAAAEEAPDNSPFPERTISVQVLDPEGQPVPDAVVIPWAIRSARGHGLWHPGEDPKQKPPKFRTDAQGLAQVSYPVFHEAAEQIKVSQVSLSLNHPQFVFSAYENVAVPRETDPPHVIHLQRGGVLELLPALDGRELLDPPDATLHVLSSDGRGVPSANVVRSPDGKALRLEPMAPGTQSARLTLLDNRTKRATHIGPCVHFESEPGKVERFVAQLKPTVRLTGRFSDVAPRPVRNGRVVFNSLADAPGVDGVTWFSWAPVAENGTFVIEDWPADDPVQVTALCDGFRAASGVAPPVVKPAPKPDPFLRPQAFLPQAFAQSLTVDMTPLVRCEVVVVDAHGRPVAGAEIGSYPNVQWWNGGSNVYCRPWVSSVSKALAANDYQIDNRLPREALPTRPFYAVTDAAGRVMLELPEGKQYLYLESTTHELPVVRGDRHRRILVISGAPMLMRLAAQPKGIELQGDWDKLSGVMFGCSGPGCQRKLDNPIFAAEMKSAADELDRAADPTDSALLGRVYGRIANAFLAVGDADEAARWRRKAAQEAAKTGS